MKRLRNFLLVALVAALPFTLHQAASSQQSAASAGIKKVGDFALLDQNGYFRHMAWYDNNRAIVLLVQTNDSKAARGAVPAYRQTLEKYQGKPLVFMMLNAAGEERAAVAQTAASYGLDIPILIDDAQVVAEAAEATTAGEVLVYDPKSFSLVYRGPAGASLDAALDEVLAGRAVSKPSVAFKGDRIRLLARDSDLARKVSYSREVAPILAKNCAACHRAGGIGPFALDSHLKAKSWSPMIREVLMNKRMPPGQIDPHVGKFLNGATLTNEEQQKLLHWIQQGSVKDGDRDPLAELTWPKSVWQYGEPDLVIQVPTQTIPATGVMPYTRITVPIKMDKDRYVRASQYVAGDRTVLHHTLNDLIGPPGAGRGGAGDAYIQPYVPGVQAYREPDKTGGLLRAGSSIALQLHYTTTGKPTTDTSRIGVWLYPEGQVPEKRMAGQCACIFTPAWKKIPAGNPNFEQSAVITIPRAAYIHSFLPHMHFRGKYMRFTALYPDGRKEELINIANYSYNWQITYQLAEPKLVPAGTKILATAALDNSRQNKANPDPTRTVPWGQQSWDEMFFGAVRWQYVDQTAPTEAPNARSVERGAG
ncbi:hypothetical protein BH11PSE2_BH11PSE2_19350 [soil metagenome]